VRNATARPAARPAVQQSGLVRRAVASRTWKVVIGGLAVALLLAPLLICGIFVVKLDRATAPAEAVPVLATPAALAPPSAEAVRVAPSPSIETAPPVQLIVPALGIDSRLAGLRVDREGRLQTPQDYDRAGWYRDGVVPGDPGPAVLVGHVDSHSGPAVFFGLSSLKKGDIALVRRADGTTVTFVVQSIESFPKDEFPTERVYGSTEGPELRLITCGGEFDRRSDHYLNNIVVFATLAQPAPEGQS
jgi:hypothetical protein